MADRAFNDLVDIMRDKRVGLRDRVNAAVSASRIAPLGLGGDKEPEVIAFLRSIVDYNRDGAQLSPSLRRDASAAAGFWERRARKAAITYDVGDPEERAAEWRRVINGALRAGDPQHALLDHNDTFELPPGDPDRVLAALFLPASSTQARRRQRAVDDPGGVQPITTEAERLALLKPLADIVEARLKSPAIIPQPPREVGAAR